MGSEKDIHDSEGMTEDWGETEQGTSEHFERSSLSKDESTSHPEVTEHSRHVTYPQETQPEHIEHEKRGDSVAIPSKGLPSNYEDEFLQEELDSGVSRHESHSIPSKGLPSNYEDELLHDELTHEIKLKEGAHKEAKLEKDANFSIPGRDLPNENANDAVLGLDFEQDADEKKKAKEESWLGKHLTPAATNVLDSIHNFGKLDTRGKIGKVTQVTTVPLNQHAGAGVVRIGATGKPTGVAYMPPHMIGFQGYNTFRAPVWGEKSLGSKGRKGSYSRALAPNVLPGWITEGGVPWNRPAKKAIHHGAKAKKATKHAAMLPAGYYGLPEFRVP